MQATITVDTGLRQLLQPLLAVRHPHLRPLVSVRDDARRLALYYGQPPACEPGCEGLRGAVRAIHGAGLWVGDLVSCIGLDNAGRVVLTGVGSTWDLRDPFAGHPAAHTYDLRVRWRQQGDLLQLDQLADALISCP